MIVLPKLHFHQGPHGFTQSYRFFIIVFAKQRVFHTSPMGCKISGSEICGQFALFKGVRVLPGHTAARPVDRLRRVHISFVLAQHTVHGDDVL